MFGAVLDYLADLNETPINTLIEVLDDGSIHQRSWIDGGFEPAHIDDPTW